jgi:hypothetical protein
MASRDAWIPELSVEGSTKIPKDLIAFPVERRHAGGVGAGPERTGKQGRSLRLQDPSGIILAASVCKHCRGA